MRQHPAPEVPCRSATEDEIPRAAKAMRKAAQAAGWRVRATYARGTRPGRPPRVCDSLALRMRHSDGRYAVTCWVDGKRSLGLAVTSDGLLIGRLGANDLKRWLQND